MHLAGSYIYRSGSAVNRANYRIESYKKTFGEESPEYKRLENMLSMIPEQYVSNGKIIKPQTAASDDDAWPYIEAIALQPTVAEIKRAYDKMKKKEAKEKGREYQESTWEEFRTTMEFNTRIEDAFNAIAPQLYEVLDKNNADRFPQELKEQANNLLESYKIYKIETDPKRKAWEGRMLLGMIDIWKRDFKR